MKPKRAIEAERKAESKPAASPLSTAVKYPDELSADDKALFCPALHNFIGTEARMKSAQQSVQEAQRVLADANAAHTRSDGAVQYLLTVIRPKYGLDGHETISLDGKITR